MGLIMDVLRGDFSKALNNLNWKPKVNFKQLVQLMVDNDLRNK